MSGGFFDDVEDLDTIPDDPFALPNNTYRVRIIEAKYGPTKDTKENDVPKFGILVKYQITEGDYATFFPFTEWLHCPGKNDDPVDAKVKMSFSNLKKHFLAYGFGNDELRGIKPDNGFDTKEVSDVTMLVDRECFVRVATKNDKNDRKQIQVQDVTSVDGSTSVSGNTSSGEKKSIVDF